MVDLKRLFVRQNRSLPKSCEKQHIETFNNSVRMNNEHFRKHPSSFNCQTQNHQRCAFALGSSNWPSIIRPDPVLNYPLKLAVFGLAIFSLFFFVPCLVPLIDQFPFVWHEISRRKLAFFPCTTHQAGVLGLFFFASSTSWTVLVFLATRTRVVADVCLLSSILEASPPHIYTSSWREYVHSNGQGCLLLLGDYSGTYP